MNRHSHRGFTLYEVLLAIGILGFVVTPLLFMFRSSVSTMQRGKSNLQALFLAQHIMESIKHELADPVEGYNTYEQLENIQEYQVPVVHDRPDKLQVLGEMVKGYSTVAIAVADPQAQFESGTVPQNPSQHFTAFEDSDGNGHIDYEGIKKEEYPDLYKTLSKYIVSVKVEKENFPHCSAEMKKIVVTVRWLDRLGKPQSLSLFTWEGPNVSNL